MNKAPQSSNLCVGSHLRDYVLHQQRRVQLWVAEAVYMIPHAISPWIDRQITGGIEALGTFTLLGDLQRLSPSQHTQLPQLLAKGAKASGFDSDIWTQTHNTAVVKAKFDAIYHRNHVRRVLELICLSVLKPIKRANQRTEAAIMTCGGQADAQKKAETAERSIVRVDETSS